MARAVGASGAFLRLGTAVLSRLSGSGLPRTLVPLSESGACWREFGSSAGPDEIPDGSKKRGWGQTKIRELLNWKKDQGNQLFCSQDDMVFDAVSKMAKANVGSLLVFDPSKITADGVKKMAAAPGDAVVGIITERDYLTKMVVEGRSSKDTAVREVMTPESKLMTVTLDHSVAETMQIMADKNVRHLPVVDKDSMMGMVSIRDVVKVMVLEHRQEMDQMHQYIQGMY